jgi:hypothetical protein
LRGTVASASRTASILPGERALPRSRPPRSLPATTAAARPTTALVAADNRGRCMGRPHPSHATGGVVAWDDRACPMQPAGSLHGTTAPVPCNQRGRCMGRPRLSHATSGVVAWDDRACSMQRAGSLHGTGPPVPRNDRARSRGEGVPSVGRPRSLPWRTAFLRSKAAFVPRDERVGPVDARVATANGRGRPVGPSRASAGATRPCVGRSRSCRGTRPVVPGKGRRRGARRGGRYAQTRGLVPVMVRGCSRSLPRPSPGYR